jgi:hypothetical protein
MRAFAFVLAVLVNMAAALPVITNVESMFSGYDVVVSEPFVPTNPGIKAHIFSASFANNNTTPDGSYLIPDGVQINMHSACSYASEVSAFTFMTSGAAFQAGMLSGVAGVGAGTVNSPILQAAFTASSIYETVTGGSSDGSIVSIGGAASCTVYQAIATSPPLDPEFAARIASLNISAPSDLLQLTLDYGTHYIKSAYFGGTILTFTRLHSSSYYNLSESGVALSSAAGIAILAAAGANVSTINGNAAYYSMMNASVDAYTWAYSTPGSPPPPPNNNPNDGSAWAAAISLGTTPGPAIITTSLAPISTLLTATNFPLVSDIAARAAALASYVDVNYCAHYNSGKAVCSYLNPSPVVAYFFATCPADWVPYAPAGGRMIIGVSNVAPYLAGIAVGEALLDSQDPLHNHTLTIPYSFHGSDNFAATSGGIDGTTFIQTDGATYEFISNLSTSASGLPLAQIVTCTLPASSSVAFDYTFPNGGLQFFDFTTPSCPANWQLPTSFPQGFTMVSNAITNTVPSISPIVPGSALAHSHLTTDVYSTPGPQAFCAASGSQSGVPEQTNPVSGTTSSSSSLPYLSLLQCEAKSGQTSEGKSIPGLLTFAVNCSLVGTDTAETWVPYPLFDGRFLVSAPIGAKGGLFGSGSPIPSGSPNTFANAHTHNSSSQYVPTPNGVKYTVFGACDLCLDVFPPTCNMHVPECYPPNFGPIQVAAAADSPPFLQLQLCIRLV